MELLPLCLCLVSLSGSTFADGNGPKIVKVTEGDKVTLPCNINKNIVSGRFDWTKDGKKDVYLYEGTQLSGQDDQFRGRVSHFDHELKNGNASITISDTKVSDSGVYTCNFPNLHQTFSVRLVVGPKIVKVTEGDDATLPCNINKNIVSGRFYWMKDGKKDVYLYEGTQLSGQDDQFRGRVSHFDHELKNGTASITIRNTTVSDSGVYTCNFPNLRQTFSVRLYVGKVAKLQTKKIPKMKDGVLLLCLVSDASPDFKLNISWFDSSGNKLDSQLEFKKSGEPYILNTTVTMSDTYRCEATMEELSHRVNDSVSVTDEDFNNKTGSSGLRVAPCLITVVLFLTLHVTVG